jgi:hypothetical protein
MFGENDIRFTDSGCGKNVKYIKGLEPEPLPIYYNHTICIKRDPSLTYHLLADARGAPACPFYPAQTGECGSSVFSDKNYCLQNDRCPVNSFEVFNGSALNYTGPNKFF